MPQPPVPPRPAHVLVTGGAGFIGSFVVEGLVGRGYCVRVLDNLDPQVHGQHSTPLVPAGVDFRRADVRDRRACADALDGVEAVVHCAGVVGVAQSLYRIEHYVDVNVRGTATLLELLAEQRSAQPVKVVVPTSMTAYGEGLYRRPSDCRSVRVGIRDEATIAEHGWQPVCPETGEALEAIATPETTALLAGNVYALTKRYQEELALAVGAVYGIPVVCLRLFNVYGPRQSLSNPYTGVLAIFLSRLLAGERPVVYEDGEQTRDFVSVHDVVHAVLSALETSRADGQVINVGSGTPRCIADVARQLAVAAGAAGVVPEITRQFRRGDVRHCTADIARARAALDFAPRVAWEHGLAELVAWSREVRAIDGFAVADRELRAHGLVSGPLRKDTL